MKARLLCAVAFLVVLSSSGCQSINLCDGGGIGHGNQRMACKGLGPTGGGGSGVADGRTLVPAHHPSRTYQGPQGPATAQVGYPYYTTRGPRDFLQNNPPTIGN